MQSLDLRIAQFFAHSARSCAVRKIVREWLCKTHSLSNCLECTEPQCHLRFCVFLS